MPFAFVTEQDIKQNFLRIQDEIESLFHRPALNQAQPLPTVASNGQAGYHPMPGEKRDLDF